MSMLTRALCRLQPRILPGVQVRNTVAPSRAITRSLVVLSSNRIVQDNIFLNSKLCSCGCGIHGMHTRGDRELVEFLREEIVAEKKSLKGSVPSHIDDFSVKVKDAEVILTKNFHDEKITVTLNVNHTVDSDETAEVNLDQSSEVALKSRPSFEVDLQIGSKTMSFTCSYTSPGDVVEGQDQVEDTFGINELIMYEGEWSEDNYCVSGDILDGMMYDLLMNMLEERGITNDFAERLSNVCSDYEHSLYVSLLQQVEDFVKRK
ncbi:complement component 1 Q subcomponent-binding protein, mitochondrial-like [Homarus americanus]|uniref:Complement component 1 Q subcomponent-binding protein-like n=1 Tax=Homarus americanus TaxID=6706 RepID=A0A8J5K4Q9_HOMAM|nr:complement component 1 Q subcomponent-binding protein, mitochondrial-like [Homarus americanus]KAG7167861.1 Complement component 1 Q subcomponent-binding protein-like [Homarus americanus]